MYKLPNSFCPCNVYQSTTISICSLLYFNYFSFFFLPHPLHPPHPPLFCYPSLFFLILFSFFCSFFFFMSVTSDHIPDLRSSFSHLFLFLFSFSPLLPRGKTTFLLFLLLSNCLLSRPTEILKQRFVLLKALGKQWTPEK